MSEFKPFVGTDYDEATRRAFSRLPDPIQIKELPDGKWCIKIRLQDTPLAAIQDSPIACAQRMLSMTKCSRQADSDSDPPQHA